MKIGWSEQLLRSAYAIPLGIFLTVPVLVMLTVSTRNVYVAAAGSVLLPIALLSVLAVRVHHQTGRWWFDPLPKHVPEEEPSYKIPIARFLAVIESAPEEKE
jgi:hypothetical protein